MTRHGAAGGCPGQPRSPGRTGKIAAATGKTIDDSRPAEADEQDTLDIEDDTDDP